jgi:O-antigen ligase
MKDLPAREDRYSREAILRAGCVLIAFLIPLKLSLTYIALIPLILLWAFTERKSFNLSSLPLDEKRVIVPLVFFLSSVALSSLFGINPLRSLNLLISLFFFSATVLVFSRYGELVPVLSALLAGQALAALHSVLDAAFPETLPSLFIGKVSESGQLALTLLVSLGILWRMHSAVLGRLGTSDRRRLLAGSLLATLAFTSFGFRAHMQISLLATLCLVACAIVVILPTVMKAVRDGLTSGRYALLLTLQLPLLIAALLVNLKRGPWLGVLVGSTLFFVVFAPRVAALVLSVSTVAAIGIAPVAERLAASYQHFTIMGGRSTIWRIGAELIAQFPLGIGFHNSDTLRKFAPEIPPELRHFHNNILNITAENGWLACALFVWFICAVVRRSFAKPLDAAYVAIGCAIISWQTAGLVEYNVGDSEVMLLVWVLVGVLLYDQRKALSASKSNSALS